MKKWCDAMDDEQLSHDERVEIFKETVLDVVDGQKSVVFLDTDKMLATPLHERAEEAARQIKEQSHELYTKLVRENESLSFNAFESIASVNISEYSASANSIKGLDDLAVITTPSVKRDEISEFIPSKDAITDMPINVDKFPGTDRDMIMYVAAHEAAHIKTRGFDETRETNMTLSGVITEEMRADNIADEYMKKHGNPDIGTAYTEIRALNNLLNGLPGDHSTSGYDTGESEEKNIEEAKNARSIMDEAVTKASGQDGFGVLLTDPQEYAKIVQESLIKDNPENLDASQLEKIEILNNAIGTYLRATPDIESTPDQAIPIEDSSKNNSLGGVNGTAVTYVIDSTPDTIKINTVDIKDAVATGTSLIEDTFNNNTNTLGTMVDALVEQVALESPAQYSMSESTQSIAAPA